MHVLRLLKRAFDYAHIDDVRAESSLRAEEFLILDVSRSVDLAFVGELARVNDCAAPFLNILPRRPDAESFRSLLPAEHFDLAPDPGLV